MAIEILVPRLGWSADDGLFAGWLKRDGDQVRPGDAIFSLETDKATQDVESLDGGILRIATNGPQVGQKVTVGTLLGHLVQPGEAAPAPVANSSNGGTAQKIAETEPPTPAAGPAARRVARELSVDLNHVAGSGRSGRVTPEDVRRHHHARVETAAPAPSDTQRRRGPAISPRARRVAAELGIDWTQLSGSGRTGRIRERDVRAAATSRPQRGTTRTHRKTIAARMLHSAQSTAPVTLTATADATNLVNLRDQFKATAGAASIPGYTDFFIKLAAVALREQPHVNARWEGDDIILLPDIHVGIAVDTEAGLLVPVLRDVPAVGLRELANRSRDLADRARRRQLKAEEMRGGTFTVTNLGAFGIDAFTPILNHPEAAILGIGRMRREPVVRDNQIVVRDTVVLSLTFDHRILDGAPAARFLQRLCQLVENPGPYLVA